METFCMMRGILGLIAILASLDNGRGERQTDQVTSEMSTVTASASQKDVTDMVTGALQGDVSTSTQSAMTRLVYTSERRATGGYSSKPDMPTGAMQGDVSTATQSAMVRSVSTIERGATGSVPSQPDENDHLSTTAGSGEHLETETDFYNVSSYEESFVERSDDATFDSIQWKWRAIQWSWWQSLQLMSSALGLVGQMLVMLVIWQRREMNRSTDTLIGALAVADFLTSIFILPLPVAVSVPSSILGEVYCRLIYNGFFMWWAVGGSIYTLALISLERLTAVMYPIYFNRFSSRRHASLAAVLVWLLVLVANLNLVLTCTIDAVSHTCVLSFSPSVGVFLGTKAFLVYFVIPATVMLLAQAVTAYVLHRKSTQFQEGNAQKNKSNPSYNLLVAKNRVIKMLFIVVMIFIICWGPNTTAYFLFNLGFISRSFAFSSTNRILTLLAFYNSCLNPIVYSVRHPEFRAAIRGLFTGSKPLGRALFEYKSDSSRGQKKTEVKI